MGDWKVNKIVYTAYESKADNHFSSFNRFDRHACLKNCFKGDAKALDEAEAKSEQLIQRFMYYLLSENAELPAVMRFDVLAHHTGVGSASVRIGELTELGGCFLGWPEGPKTVFDAVIKTCLGNDGRGGW